MATKFMKLNEDNNPVINKTVFSRQLWGGRLEDADHQPEHYDNVLFLGTDGDYGDVFKAWDDEDVSFWLYFGEKGDEFND